MGGLGRGDDFFWFEEILKDKEGEKIGRKIVLGNSHRALLLL
jgi:hypothetical protein